jgi:hypothetical protein
MKLQLTFNIDCGNILIDTNSKEELDWLKDEILKIGGTDWAIISGEIGDDIGNESITLIDYKILHKGVLRRVLISPTVPATRRAKP